MSAYAIRRALLMIPMLIGISLLSFILLKLAPGDPVLMYVNPHDPQTANPEALEALRRAYGLDRPMPVQYFVWLKGVISGDWGYSFRYHQPVLELLLERLPTTISLTGSALLIAMVIAVPVGVISAVKQHQLPDYILSGLVLLALSLPNFWVALMLVELFATHLGWLPAVGSVPLGESSLAAKLKHAILPVTVLALGSIAPWARYLRSSTLEIVHQDFVRTARAKGLSERTVIYRHILRNALLPIVTLIGLSARSLVTGAYIIEAMFAWPGMGRLTIDGVFGRDYPLIMGATILTSTVVIIANFLSDLMYVAVDPRIRYN